MSQEQPNRATSLAMVAGVTIAAVLLVAGVVFVQMTIGQSNNRGYGSPFYSFQLVLGRWQTEHFAVAFAAMALLWRGGTMRIPAAAVAAGCLVCLAVMLALLLEHGPTSFLASLIAGSAPVRTVLALLFLWTIPLAGATLLGVCRFHGAPDVVRWIGMLLVCASPAMLTQAYFADNLWKFYENETRVVTAAAAALQALALVVVPVLYACLGGPGAPTDKAKEEPAGSQ